MKPAKKSAGIVLYRIKATGTEVLLVHPGGPFWAKKDSGAWSIPKGEFGESVNPLDEAIREFREETGYEVTGNFIPLTPCRMKSGKTIFAWACEGDLDADRITSNLFSLEWPPHSGRTQTFPEVDKAGWFGSDEALRKIIPAQADFVRQTISITTGRTK
jgi:predicted NUDIX family NTP pyrophosphohydrolase